jgi:hypothetical protein
MKHIRKDIRNEPNWFKQHKANWNPRDNNNEMLPSFQRNPPSDNSAEQEALPIALAKEQYYLCCYCMKVINEDDSGKDVTPEHFISQNKFIRNNHSNPLDYHDSSLSDVEHKQLRTNYNNILASCSGGKGCSALKGNYPFVSDPRLSICETTVEILDDGKIESKNTDWQKDITVLQLDRFEAQRKSVIDVAQKRIYDRKTEDQEKFKTIVQEEITFWLTPKKGRLRPYCMAAVHYLKRKLK